MPQPRRIERQKAFAQLRFVRCAIGPESTPRCPERPQAFVVRYRVLDDQGLNALGMRERQSKADRPAVVLEIQHIAFKAKSLDESIRHLRRVVEGKGEALGRGASEWPKPG